MKSNEHCMPPATRFTLKAVSCLQKDSPFRFADRDPPTARS